MDLDSLHAELGGQWLLLRQRWAQAGQQWTDSVQRYMQREIWQPFERTVPPALIELERLADTIKRARNALR